MYEQQSYEGILQRLLDAVPSDIQKSEGSFIYDALAPAALELAQAYVELDNVLNLGFASTTCGQYLDYRAVEHGINRKPATQASGQVTISGATGTIIPAGSIFATGAGVHFASLAEAAVGDSGSITADIRTVDAGTRGNVPAGAITQIPVLIAGITAVTNASPTTGGTDQETDAALLERLLEKVRTPATSGNTAHYLQWAKSVSGIGDARIFPLWNGNGTVGVVLIDADKQPADPEIIADAAAYIDSVRPIGATVTVDSAAALPVDIAAAVTLANGTVLADVQAAFETALAAYLKQIAFKQSYVSYAQVGTMIMNIPGVMDYTGLTLNGSTANIAVGNTQVAVKGTVSLHE